MAAFNCLKAFASHATDLSVLIQLDNATVVAYINKRGGSKSAALNQISVDVSALCEEKRIDVQAIHLPGCLNFIANHEYWCKVDSSD